MLCHRITRPCPGQVADSGKPYAIIRAYGTDRTEDGDEPGPYLAIGNQGTIPTNQVSSKAQVGRGGKGR